MIGLFATTDVCTSARDSAIASVEVWLVLSGVAGGGVGQKQAIVAAAFGLGAVVRDVVRQPDMTARFDLPLEAGSSGCGENGLRSGAGGADCDGIATPPVVAIEIEFAGNARVRIPPALPRSRRRIPVCGS